MTQKFSDKSEKEPFIALNSKKEIIREELRKG